MAAKSSWHRYLTKLRHCHSAYTSRTRHESRAHLAKAAKLDVERTTRKDDVHVESSKRRRRRRQKAAAQRADGRRGAGVERRAAAADARTALHGGAQAQLTSPPGRSQLGARKLVDDRNAQQLSAALGSIARPFALRARAKCGGGGGGGTLKILTAPAGRHRSAAAPRRPLPPRSRRPDARNIPAESFLPTALLGRRRSAGRAGSYLSWRRRVQKARPGSPLSLPAPAI